MVSNMPIWGWVLIVLLVLIAAIVVITIFGNKMQEKQIAQKEQMLEAAQPVTMLIIDKKIMPLKDAKLPKVVMEQLEEKGKRYTKAKVPIVKAKVGPQIVSLICDDAIYEDVPSRGEVKAMVSGIYLVSVKSIRGKKVVKEEELGKKKKGGWRQRLMRKQAQYQKELSAEVANKKSKEEIKAEKEKKKKNEERAKKITV